MSIVKVFRFTAALAIFGTIGLLIGFYDWFGEMALPVANAGKKEISVESGSNTRKIATQLKTQQVIRSALAFRIYVRFIAVDQRLKPGIYTFNGNETLYEVIFKLLKGNMPTVQVTVPEGITIAKAAAILQDNGVCNAPEFIEAVSDPQLLGRIFSDWALIPAPEGLIFPDTYSFARPSSGRKVAERMLRLTRHQIDRIFVEPLPGQLSQYEACILASIVEKEAALAHERAIIASVFYNRLSKNIRLESCATVLYALGGHKSRLLFEDLKVASPFNTYLNPGLPPTPIANFGASAMAAVAKPAETDYLYFVSDGKRGHRFARTLGDHNRFRSDYFKQRKKKSNNQ
ncbi:MAG: endolytic transglycosylase MltG [Candidatus Riflebacteria bacterium HGW-Riflebacteria-2]|nr:MAG: endolytic transglycosylase MltG [Candidatus Riflebacteria bacterium HGW-Riflebacteria-2]